MSRRTVIEAGTRFGTWTVLSYAGRRGHSSYWNCRCACGKEKAVIGYALKGGVSKRCTSCKIRDVLSRPEVKLKRFNTRVAKRPPGTSALNQLYAQYGANAKKRNYTFALSRAEFSELVSQDCHYCGGPPQNIKIPHNPAMGTLVYNGIDRKDNSMGYIAKNCVPCCFTCNCAKATLSYEEFSAWIARVFKNFGNKSL